MIGAVPTEPRPVYLVTGARGALATQLLALLADTAPGTRVVAAARDAGGLRLPGSAEPVEGDLRASETWRSVPDDVSHVFHLAARIARPGEAPAAAVALDNLEPVARLLEAAERWPALRQVVYASSVSVYGATDVPVTEDAPARPVSAYAAAKLAGEHLLAPLRARGVRVACIRYGSLYGPGQRAGTAIPAMLDAAQRAGEVRVFGAGGRRQDFLHYEDAARLALLAAERRADGVYNGGSGRATSMAELARAVCGAVGGRARVVFDRARSEGEPGYDIDMARAGAELGFAPRVPLGAGLRRLVHPEAVLR